jgi:hypothetical protein
MEVCIPAANLQAISDESPGEDLSDPVAAPPPVSGHLASRRAVEALRFGLVPPSGLKELTIGYEDVERWTSGRFPDTHGGKPTISEVCGPFGTGKSHTMALIRQIAISQNYLTAHVEVDGNSVSLADPGNLLYALWSTLETPKGQSATPVLDLYYGAISRAANLASVRHGPDRVATNFRAIRGLKALGVADNFMEELDAFLSSNPAITAGDLKAQLREDPNLRGQIVEIRPMLGMSWEERPADFICALAGHSQLALLAGYKGLVITIDEFEVERAHVSKAKHERLLAVLGKLVDFLGGQSVFLPAPLAIFFGSVGQEGLPGDGVLSVILDAVKGERWKLDAWMPEAYTDLGDRIRDLYARAYDLVIPPDPALTSAVRRELERQELDQVRDFIKRYVGRLDATYGPPAA